MSTPTLAPGIREDDPPGSEFYSWPTQPPAGDWSYIVDDFNIAYRHDTLWPFKGSRTGEGSDEAAVASLKKRGEDWTPRAGCGYHAVSFVPDLDYTHSGGQNKVTVWPDLREAWKASADLHLYVRLQGQGAIVTPCTLVIDLRDMTAYVTTWPIDGSPIGADGFSEDFPESLKEQAAERKAKILALLADHMARRDAGKRKIDTHYDRWYLGRK